LHLHSEQYPANRENNCIGGKQGNVRENIFRKKLNRHHNHNNMIPRNQRQLSKIPRSTEGREQTNKTEYRTNGRGEEDVVSCSHDHIGNLHHHNSPQQDNELWRAIGATTPVPTTVSSSDPSFITAGAPGTRHQQEGNHELGVGAVTRTEASGTASPLSLVVSRDLAADFEPGEYDIIVKQGQTIAFHSGNHKFSQLLMSRVLEYEAANKEGKSRIISDVVQTVFNSKPKRGFYKFDPVEQQWIELTIAAAKKKTSQSFRNLLHHKYKSSSKSKHAKRRRREAKTELQQEHLEQYKEESSKKSAFANDDILQGCSFAEGGIAIPVESNRGHEMGNTCGSSHMQAATLSQQYDAEDEGQPSTTVIRQETDVWEALLSSLAKGDEDKTDDPFEPTPLPNDRETK